MEIQESKAVVVSNISPGATEKTVSDFFSFCGKISKLYMKKDDGTSTAVVEFESESAAKTALLLTNALIVDRPITVSMYGTPSANSNTQTEQATTPTTLGTEVDQSKITQRDFNVPDEQRSKTSVVASLLAAGYVLTSDAFVKAKEVDEKHMLTLQAKVAMEQVKVKAHELDKQLGISEKAAVVEKTIVDAAKQLDTSFHLTEKTKEVAKAISTGAHNAANKFEQVANNNPTISKGVETVKQTASNLKTTVQTTYQDVKEKTQKAIEEKQRERGKSQPLQVTDSPANNTDNVATTTSMETTQTTQNEIPASQVTDLQQQNQNI